MLTEVFHRAFPWLFRPAGDPGPGRGAREARTYALLRRAASAGSRSPLQLTRVPVRVQVPITIQPPGRGRVLPFRPERRSRPWTTGSA